MSETSVTPVQTVAYFEVAPAAVAQVTELLGRWAATARTAPGTTALTVLRRTVPGNHFALVARWTSRESYDAARDGGPGTGLRSSLAPHLICGIDVRIHNALIAGPDTARGSGSVNVVTHVDVPPPNKDACIALLETQVAASRKEAGCNLIEVFQQADRPNHFSVVEQWASDAAYGAHIVAEHTRAFRMQLTPLSGALYDERLYAGL